MKRMKTMRKEEKTSVFPKDWEKKADIVNGFLKDPDNYLRSIGLYKRLEERKILPAIEIKQLLRENFKKYFRGEVTQKFIIGLAWRLYELCYASIEGPETAQILGVTCPIQDFEIEIMQGGKIKKTPQEIDRLIRQLFEEHLK
jgi:hypothetical protein